MSRFYWCLTLNYSFRISCAEFDLMLANAHKKARGGHICFLLISELSFHLFTIYLFLIIRMCSNYCLYNKKDHTGQKVQKVTPKT